ncbi:MAG: aldolase [Clostridia bacterium]|nr:aldolase [Clostridia bacterium]
MHMKLMYITNNPQVASIAESVGVDRIFVDMEYIGKDLRQGGMDTVQNHHTVEDIKNIRKVLKKSELLVRINPIHDGSSSYSSTEDEIEEVIAAGANIIMLPYFNSKNEAERFLKAVNGRCKTVLLFETPEAVENIDEILDLPLIDEVYIGLNDLSLGYGYKFMFKPLADGTVESMANKFKNRGLKFGFGGIASIGSGMLKSEKILAEHIRMGSSCVILSRSFCNIKDTSDTDSIHKIFLEGVKNIRELESFYSSQTEEFFKENFNEIKTIVDTICG